MSTMLKVALVAAALLIVGLATGWALDASQPENVTADLVAQSQGLLGLTAGGPFTADALNAIVKQVNAAPKEERDKLAAAAAVLMAYSLYVDKSGEATVEGDNATVKLQAQPLSVALVKQGEAWQVDLAKTLAGMPLGARKNAPLLFSSLYAPAPPAPAATTHVTAAHGDPVMELDDDNYAEKVEKAKGLVLVDFFATWCGPCNAMKPVYHQFAADYADRMKFGSIDIDQSPDTARKYKIEAIPTLILYQDGKKVAEEVGFCNADKIKAMVAPYLQ